MMILRQMPQARRLAHRQTTSAIPVGLFYSQRCTGHAIVVPALLLETLESDPN
jgi:hypothetical protein